MSLLDSINDERVWQQFLEYKSNAGHLTKGEARFLARFVQDRMYSIVSSKIISGQYQFGLPMKMLLNKSGSQKKRTVYRYSAAETMVLKLVAFLLYKYDGAICPNCYSFRRNATAQTAISCIASIKDIQSKYALKIDVSNYFNSIPSAMLQERISQVISDDAPLRDFLIGIISQDKACSIGSDGRLCVLQENRGAMAGVPISAFLANIYLSSLDEHFWGLNVPYFRYSDDIMVFAGSMQEIDAHRSYICCEIRRLGLAINASKTRVCCPGDRWDFLGFCFNDGKIDISEVAISKMKSKIRRKAKSLRRRMCRQGMAFDMAASDLIDHFCKKFYKAQDGKEFSWARWFFPVIQTADSLRAIDLHLVQYVRYLSTGRHCKKNFKISYQEIKLLGFRSLVHEYYRYRKTNQLPEYC